ncbi:MAG: hypothetical protein NVS2B12_07010 [Ktedonobacteraceae bacterium]
MCDVPIDIDADTQDGNKMTRAIMAGFDKNACNLTVPNKNIIGPLNSCSRFTSVIDCRDNSK